MDKNIPAEIHQRVPSHMHNSRPGIQKQDGMGRRLTGPHVPAEISYVGLWLVMSLPAASFTLPPASAARFLRYSCIEKAREKSRVCNKDTICGFRAASYWK
jgi:hypothetical protein